MGKAKRKHPDVEELLSRPWCYYCERDFDDLKILINHQKAKHFKCDRCGRRLNTAGGLSVHMTQVHKESLTIIENALPNRSGLEVEIFGMEGIPGDVAFQHQQRVLQNFAQAEAERRAATGNPPPGTIGGTQPKKPKFESPADLKMRLAEHKAKMAVQAAGAGSGESTPTGAAQSPGAGSPGFAQPQMSYGAPATTTATFSAAPQTYAQQPTFHQQQSSPFPPQQSPFSPPGQPQFQSPGFPPNQQFPSPGGPGFQPQFMNGPPNFQNGAPHFQSGPSAFNGPPHQFQNGPLLFQNGPPQAFGPGSSAPPFQQNPFQTSRTPPQQQNLPQRPANLPPVPGLPQRPSFGVPPVNAFQMQQMHQGQLPGPTQMGQSNVQQIPPSTNVPGGAPGAGPDTSNVSDPASAPSANAITPGELSSGAFKEADKSASAAGPSAEAAKPEESKDEKKAKKEKPSMKLVYSDNETSPEEKMANMARYAFVLSG